MLDAFIIDEIRRKQEEEERKRDGNRPHAPPPPGGPHDMPEHDPDRKPPQDEDPDKDRGVVIIDLKNK